MQPRKPRQISRELALLSLSQLPANPKKLTEAELPKLVLAAVRTLTSEVQETLDNATAELQRSNARLLSSQTRAIDLNTSRNMLQEAITCTETAINQLRSKWLFNWSVKNKSINCLMSYSFNCLINQTIN